MVGKTSRRRESPSTPPNPWLPPGNGLLIKAISGVVATVFFSTGTHAQECVEIAKVIGREMERVVSLEQAQRLRLETFCSSRINEASGTARAQIEASYSLFRGGAEGSTTDIKKAQEKECKGKFGTDRESVSFSNEVDRVSRAGADVVTACFSTQSFRLVKLRVQGTAISATFKNGGNGEALINGIIVQPKEIADCKILYGGRTQEDPERIAGSRLRPNDTLTLSCERKPDPVDGNSTRLHFRGGILGVATASDTADIPLIEYQVPSVAEPVADELSRRIEQLRTEVVKLQDQTKDQQKIITQQQRVMEENFPVIFYPADFPKCPDNYDNKGSAAIIVTDNITADDLRNKANGGTNPYYIPGVGGTWQLTHPIVCVQKQKK